MKSIIKAGLLFFAVTAFFAACDKVDDLPFYGKGTAPVLSASSTSVAPAPADSNATALTLNWTVPNYATDSSTVKYVIEMDSTGKNFSSAATKVVTGTTSASFLAKELNDILLAKGYPFGTPVSMDVRVTSSYANNNERLASNTVTVQMTPYKVPPKVALPATNHLYIVGDATEFGWTNEPAPPAFPAAQELTQISETQWAGIFNMKGGGGYKLVQTQGVWSTQYHKVSGDAASGIFEQKDADPGFSGPADAGAYKLVVDFQTGTYTVTKVENAAPVTLYITGDATPSSWTNAPPDAQKFTPVTNGVFEITMAFVPGKAYKFLSSSGNWQPQFGGASATGGTLGANFGGGDDPAAVPTPAEAGTYKIQVNLITNTYTVTKV